MKKNFLGCILLVLVVINVSNWSSSTATALNAINSVLLAVCVAVYLILLHKKKIKRRLEREKEALLRQSEE